jgi:multicomponent Na+:H+ antiporter subunit D
MKWLLVLPIIIPLSTAAASLMVWQSRRLQRCLATAGTLALLASGLLLLRLVSENGIQAVQMGS